MSEGPVPAYCAVVNLATCSAFLCILNSNDTNNHNLYSEKSVEKKKNHNMCKTLRARTERRN